VNVRRFVRTVRHLRPKQAMWLVYRRIRPSSPAPRGWLFGRCERSPPAFTSR